MSRDENVAGGITFLIFAIVMAIFAIVDCSQRNECEESGGRVEVYGHDTIMIPMSCGENCTMFYPEEVDKWRCVHDGQ